MSKMNFLPLHFMISFQLLYIDERKADVQITLRQTKYRAYTQNEISMLFQTAGFAMIRWILPK